MGLECEWRHVRKRWAENLRILKNTAVGSWLWAMTTDSWVVCHWGRQLKLGSDHDVEKLSSDHGIKKSDHDVEDLRLDDVGRQLDCLPLRQTVEIGDFEVGPWKRIVEFLPLGHRVRFRPLKDVVSIICLRKTFKNYVSLLESKKWTQKLIIKGSFLNNGVASAFVNVFVSELVLRGLS